MLDRSGAEIEYRTLEWTRSMLLDWIATNETAQAIQGELPDDYVERLRHQPHTMRPLAAAIATMIPPDAVRHAHAIMSSAVAGLERIMETGSLSHPSETMAAKTDAENGAGMASDFEAEVRRLEAKVAEVERDRDRLAGLLQMVEALAAHRVDRCDEGSPQILRDARSN